jgi:hypothetical protein
VIYRALKAQTGYGRPLGIICLEETIPCPPGTPGNPTTFGHPVHYEIVRGVAIDSLRNLNEPDSARAFLDAGRALVERGACAVAGNCGLMIVHQEALAKALPVPVLMSSLLQLPLIQTLLGPEGKIGILASSRTGLRPEHLRLATSGTFVNVAVGGMDGCPHFRAAVGDESGLLDFDKVEAEVVAAAKGLAADNPGIGAILLECVDLPPYAAAIQAATDLPVFDITTLISYAYSGLVRSRFAGVY